MPVENGVAGRKSRPMKFVKSAIPIPPELLFTLIYFKCKRQIAEI